MSDRLSLFRDLMTGLHLTQTVQSLIGGRLISGDGDAIVLKDPFSREQLAEYADCGCQIANDACSTAADVQKAWANDLTAAARAEVIQKIASAVDAQAENLARLEALVAGKPIRDCRAEVAKVSEMFRYYAGWADKLHGEVIPVPSGHLNYTLREPLGVVFQITPWNAPVFTAGWQIAPAIATGNGVVIKPSELTAVTTVALTRLAESAGLPEGLVNVLAGLGPTAGQAAIAHEAVRKVIFVGSPATGRKVAIAAAEALKPAVMELGGKSANIVFADARLDDACKGAQAAIFSAAGQSCVAGSRLLVEKSVHETFVSTLFDAVNHIKLGDPLDDSTEIGPIGNERQFAHVMGMIDAAAASGGGVLTAERPEGSGLFVAPTILTDVSPSARAAQDEIFGPVVTVLPFEDEAQALAIANNTDFGLAGAVWTRDVARAHRVAQTVRSGTFWINCYKTIHVSSPFGGARSSGYGRSSGTDALMEYTAPKSVWVETATPSRIAFGYAPDA